MDYSYNCEGFPNKEYSSENNSTIKKIHSIAGKKLIIIDEIIAQAVRLDDGSWVEEIPVEHGIFLRILTPNEDSKIP